MKQRLTISIDPDVEDALREKGYQEDRPLSRIVNQALRIMLDLADKKKR